MFQVFFYKCFVIAKAHAWCPATWGSSIELIVGKINYRRGSFVGGSLKDFSMRCSAKGREFRNWERLLSFSDSTWSFRSRWRWVSGENKRITTLVVLYRAFGRRAETLWALVSSFERRSSSRCHAQSTHSYRNANFQELSLSTLSPRCDISNHVDNCETKR